MTSIHVYVVTDDHSFKHGCFPIEIQYLTTALGRILFSSVVIVLAYQPGGPAMHLFISFFVTDFVRKLWARPGLAKESLIPFIVQKMDFVPNRLSVINK